MRLFFFLSLNIPKTFSGRGFFFALEFQCCYFCEASCLFYLSFNFDFYVSKIMHI